MRVHEIIEQQHTEAETESEEYRHQAEIFFGGYLAETAEGNCDGDCKHRPEQLAVRQFALIIIEMEDYKNTKLKVNDILSSVKNSSYIELDK